MTGGRGCTVTGAIDTGPEVDGPPTSDPYPDPGPAEDVSSPLHLRGSLSHTGRVVGGSGQGGQGKGRLCARRVVEDTHPERVRIQVFRTQGVGTAPPRT